MSDKAPSIDHLSTFSNNSRAAKTDFFSPLNELDNVHKSLFRRSKSNLCEETILEGDEYEEEYEEIDLVGDCGLSPEELRAIAENENIGLDDSDEELEIHDTSSPTKNYANSEIDLDSYVSVDSSHVGRNGVTTPASSFFRSNNARVT